VHYSPENETIHGIFETKFGVRRIYLFYGGMLVVSLVTKLLKFGTIAKKLMQVDPSLLNPILDVRTNYRQLSFTFDEMVPLKKLTHFFILVITFLVA